MEFSSMKSILGLNTQAYKIFIKNIVEDKLVYVVVVITKKRNLMTKFVYIIIDLIWYKKFASCIYYLDLLYFLLLLVKIVNTIKIQYSLILLRVKTTFYIDEIRVELVNIMLLMR